LVDEFKSREVIVRDEEENATNTASYFHENDIYESYLESKKLNISSGKTGYVANFIEDQEIISGPCPALFCAREGLI